MPGFQKKFLDAIREIGNMGAGQASGSLSKLTSQKVVLHTPHIALKKIVNVPKVIGGSQEMIVGIYNSLKGDLSGTLLIALPAKSALTLADKIQKKKTKSTTLTKQAQDKLKQIGEIVTQNYVASITQFLELNVSGTEERIISAFGESIADLALLGVKGKFALVLRTEFEIGSVKGKLILLLAMDSASTIKQAIQKKLE